VEVLKYFDSIYLMKNFTFDFWTLIGLFAQGLFFLRFIIQWYFSEKQKKTIVPKIFWYISLLGGVLTLLYAIARNDFVFLITGVLQIILYIRNIMLSRNE